MRRFAVLALAGVIGAGVVSFVGADESVQTEVAKISPIKISKSRYQNVKYTNMIRTSDVPGTHEPPKSTGTLLEFPKQLKFNNETWPVCKTDERGLESAPTPAAAKKACGRKSVVSTDAGSKVTVRVDSGSDALIVNNDVVAFNQRNGDLLLYIKSKGVFSGIAPSVLVGKLRKAKSGSKYREALNFKSSPLAAGALSLVQVTNPKSGYVQAKCKPRRLWWKATTTFQDGSKVSDTHSTKCKPKK